MDIDKLVLDISKKILDLGLNSVDVYDVQNKSKIAKRFIVCVATDNVLSKKIANEIKDFCKPIIPCLHTDGIIKGDWVVIDYKDIIVHIFTKSTYQKYNFEKLWKDSKNFLTVDSQFLSSINNQ